MIGNERLSLKVGVVHCKNDAQSGFVGMHEQVVGTVERSNIKASSEESLKDFAGRRAGRCRLIQVQAEQS